MMTRSAACVCVLLLGALAALANPDNKKELQALLAITGFQKSVESLPEAAAHDLRRAARDRTDVDRLERVLRRAFDPRPILDAVLAELESHYDAEKTRSVHEWYQSPLGRRIRQVKEASLGAEGMAGYGEFVARLRRELPPQERRTLVGRLEAAIRVVDQANARSSAVGRALDLLLERGTNQADAPKEPGESIEPAMREQMHLLLHFTTRELSLDELESYVAFTESEPFRWYRDTAFRGFERGIAAAVDSLL